VAPENAPLPLQNIPSASPLATLLPEPQKIRPTTAVRITPQKAQAVSSPFTPVNPSSIGAITNQRPTSSPAVSSSTSVGPSSSRTATDSFDEDVTVISDSISLPDSDPAQSQDDVPISAMLSSQGIERELSCSDLFPSHQSIVRAPRMIKKERQ